MTSGPAPSMLSAYIVAVFHAAKGDVEGGLAKLESSYELREPHIVMIKTDPRLDSLRDNPRFQQLLKKIGFPD